MQRDVENEILRWKSSEGRKPLVLMGARQVGKTWLMRDFGKRNFAAVHEFNFDGNVDLASVFRSTKEPVELLPKLSVLSGRKIDVERDVILFDEIQECGEALNSLKYFYEKCPQLAVMAAGSLLGLKLGHRVDSQTECSGPKSYPVGKVELLDVEPMTFGEFLREKDRPLWEFYETIAGDKPPDEIFHRKLWDAYLLYLTIGGMPEVVSSYLRLGDIRRVNKLQRDLLALYEDDIVKYNGTVDAGKILVVWRAVVPQLAKENSKFLYGALREGARARGYEDAIEWLVSARLVRRVFNVAEMGYPLSAYELRNAFKLYLLDVGLLKQMASIADEAIVLDKDFPLKGHLAENYVLQQLHGKTDGPICYYAERSDREIDFVTQHRTEVMPIEVKAGMDKKCATFKSYVNGHRPRYAIRFSERNLRRDGAFTNVPLYLAPRYAAGLDG